MPTRGAGARGMKRVDKNAAIITTPLMISALD